MLKNFGGVSLGALIAFLFILDCAFASPKAAKKRTERLVKKAEAIVQYHAGRLKVPGFAFGLIEGGKVVLKLTEGQRAITGKSKIDAQTLFQIGSIAKIFSAIVVGQLQEKKKLQLNSPLKKYLPKRCPKSHCDGIKLSHLLSHTSGIATYGSNGRIEAGESYSSIISSLIKKKKTCNPGKCYRYSNAAYELIREVIEKVTQKTYPEVLESQLLDPLKLTQTTTTLEGLKATKNFFVPHLFQKGLFKETTHSTPYYSLPGSSVLNSNLDDMLKILNAELGNSPKVVSEELLKLLHQPRVEAPDAYRRFTKPPKGKEMVSQYALGHRVFSAADFTIVFHSGWLRGCKNMMAWFPEKGVGFVLLQNSASQLIFRVLEDLASYLRNEKH